MKLLFSVYDSAVKYFRDPFVSVSKGDALSQFMTGANTKDSWLAERPQDYSLFLLGSFDEVSGKFEMYTAPESLGIAIEFVRANKLASKEMIDHLTSEPVVEERYAQ